MVAKKKAAPSWGRQDKDILKDMELLLTDFGFKLNQFAEFASEMEAHEDVKGGLDRSNIYQYFKDRPIPLYALWKLARHLCGFEIELSPEDLRLPEYQSRAKLIQDEAIQYVIKNKYNPHTVRPVIREILKGRSVLDLEQFFEGIYVLDYSERTWAFWLCFACLNLKTKRTVFDLLGEARLSPKDYTRYLILFHRWEAEVYAPIALKLKKAVALYNDPAQDKTDDTRRKKLLDTCTDILQDYSYPPDCEDKAIRLLERTEHDLNGEDCAILATYDLLCATLDGEEQRKIDRVMEEYILDEERRDQQCPEILWMDYYHRFHDNNSL